MRFLLLFFAVFLSQYAFADDTNRPPAQQVGLDQLIEGNFGGTNDSVSNPVFDMIVTENSCYHCSMKSPMITACYECSFFSAKKSEIESDYKKLIESQSKKEIEKTYLSIKPQKDNHLSKVWNDTFNSVRKSEFSKMKTIAYLKLMDSLASKHSVVYRSKNSSNHEFLDDVLLKEVASYLKDGNDIEKVRSTLKEMSQIPSVKEATHKVSEILLDQHLFQKSIYNTELESGFFWVKGKYRPPRITIFGNVLVHEKDKKLFLSNNILSKSILVHEAFHYFFDDTKNAFQGRSSQDKTKMSAGIFEKPMSKIIQGKKIYNEHVIDGLTLFYLEESGISKHEYIGFIKSKSTNNSRVKSLEYIIEHIENGSITFHDFAFNGLDRAINFSRKQNRDIYVSQGFKVKEIKNISLMSSKKAKEVLDKYNKMSSSTEVERDVELIF